MSTYDTLRHFADSWGLVGLMLVFVGAALFAFRPGSRALHRDTASIPFRNEDRPAPEPAARPAPKADATDTAKDCPGSGEGDGRSTPTTTRLEP